MFGWFKKRKQAEVPLLDVVAIAQEATRGMPMRAHVRGRALPQLLELLEKRIAAHEAEAHAPFTPEQRAEMREIFTEEVTGAAPKAGGPAPHAPDAGHQGHIEGIVAAAFDTEFDGTPARALAVADAARADVQLYLAREELAEPALVAAGERAIAEHMAAVLR